MGSCFEKAVNLLLTANALAQILITVHHIIGIEELECCSQSAVIRLGSISRQVRYHPRIVQGLCFTITCTTLPSVP